MKTLRIVGIVLGLLFALVLAGIAYVSASFDATHIRSELTRLVLEKKQRTLKIDGELSLSFWPRLGVKLGQVSLSERGSEKAFAALEAARFSVQLMPLLSKRIVIDQVELIGLQAAILRRQDGTLNIDDLLAQDKEESLTVKFDVAGIKIVNAQLGWHDEIGGGDLALNNLNLTTGHLAKAAQGKLELSTRLDGSNHKIDTQIQLSAMYDYDIDGGRFGLSKIDARIDGLLAGMQGVELSIGTGTIRIPPRGDINPSELQLEALMLRAKSQEGGDNFEVTLDAPSLLLTADKASSDTLKLRAKFAGAGRNLDARFDLSGIESNPHALTVARVELLLDAAAGETAISGKLSSTMVTNLSAQTTEMPRFSGEFAVANPQLPMKQVKLPIIGSLHADFARHSAELAASTQFDESKIAAKFILAKFTPLALGFAVDIDRLNLDRYLPPRLEDGKKITAKDGEEKLTSQLSGGPALQLAEGPALQLAEGPALFALKNINLHGTVKIGVLQFARAKVSKVRLDLRAVDGKLEMSTAAS